MSKSFHIRIVLLLIVSGVLLRLVPHLPNFTPIAAVTLFGAAYLPRKFALIVPLLALAVSDYLLLYINPFAEQIFNFSHLYPLTAAFHDTTGWVWGSLMISGLLGLLLQKKRGFVRVGTVTIISALQFYLITNFGVWMAGAYARDISGLMASYVAALPFLRWSLLGDLFYTASFFGLYALTVRSVSKETAGSKLIEA